MASSVGEFATGETGGTPGTLALVSLGVFVVTGVVWLVQHTEHWPGGYLPWMVSLGFLLFAISCFFNFRDMRTQRNQALAPGRKVVALHGAASWRISAWHYALPGAPDTLMPTLTSERDVNEMSHLTFTVEDPDGHCTSATWTGCEGIPQT
jgi:hypothetical protein